MPSSKKRNPCNVEFVGGCVMMEALQAWMRTSQP